MLPWSVYHSSRKITKPTSLEAQNENVFTGTDNEYWARWPCDPCWLASVGPGEAREHSWRPREQEQSLHAGGEPSQALRHVMALLGGHLPLHYP